MKTRTLVSIWIVFTFLLAMCGCGTAVAGDLMAGVHAAGRPESPVVPDRVFIESVGGFSWNIFREAARAEGNILVSPASAYLAMAMTVNGADGTTRDAILQTLSAGNGSVDRINTACRDWMTLLTDTEDETDLRIGNSIWYNDGFAADPAFLKTNADYYSAALRQLDFADRKAAGAINDWVSQATNGKISGIMDHTEEFDLMYLINAVYFKSNWQNPFTRTYQGDFQLGSGTATVSYMYRKGETSYLAGDGQAGVLLPFSGDRFAFVAVLPPEGISVRDAFAGMDQAALARLLDSDRQATIELHLPKFETEYQTDLQDILTHLGMGEAFQGGVADFTLMEEKHNKMLFISGISQKTFFKINETGAEAGAVTGLTIAGSTTKTETPIELVFDRPFLYGIVDTVSGLPLFLGIMEHPVS